MDGSGSIQIEPLPTLPKRTPWVLYGVYGLIGPIAAFAKMGTVPLVILAALGYPNRHALLRELKRLSFGHLGLSVLALMCWCGISLIWAEKANLLTLMRLVGVVGLAFLVPALVNMLGEQSKTVLVTILISSFLFVLIVLLTEGFTDAWLHRQIRPQDAIPREGEWVPYLEMVAARGTAILAPFSFLVATLIVWKTEKRAFGLSFVGLSFLAAYMLPMEASAIAILVGSAAYGVTLWRPKLALNAIFLACGLAMVFSPLVISNLVNKESLESLEIEVSRSQAQRLAIWEFTAQEIMKRPILGHGFDSSRVIGARDNAVEGTNWQALPLHPHNAFLQIWLELGLTGVALTCSVLWGFWKLVTSKSRDSMNCATYTSTWCALLTIALISFGIWQYWWIAMWGLLCGALTLLHRPAATA